VISERAAPIPLRYVSANGGIRWNHAWVNVGVCCAGEGRSPKQTRHHGLSPSLEDGLLALEMMSLKLMPSRTLRQAFKEVMPSKARDTAGGSLIGSLT
jgi:hypothetical protein